MKILYFSDSFGSPTTTFIRNETDFFNETEEVKYLCTKVHENDIKYDYVKIIPYHQNVINRKLKWWLWKYDLSCNFKNTAYAKSINNFIDEFQPDIIHCHFAYEGLILLDNLKDFDAHKIVIHLHGYDASKMLRKKSYVKRLKYYLKKDNVVTISCNQHFIDVLKDSLNIIISKYFVLKYGINVSQLFDPTIGETIETTGPYIIQVSSLAEKKGHEFTFRAFKTVITHSEHHHLKLYISGQGERKEHLKKLIEELEISKSVVFLGNLNPNQVASYLKGAEIFVHHSITDSHGDKEGIPNAIMEAMAMELPIVSTIHSGIPELVTDGVNGVLVREKDVDRYAKGIVKALKMGRLSQNRTKVIEEYNQQKHNSLLSDIYGGLLNLK